MANLTGVHIIGKRSDFERIPRDFYPTPREAIVPLIPHLKSWFDYAEPCAGDGSLIKHLDDLNPEGWCQYACDIKPEGSDIQYRDAMEMSLDEILFCDYIITNPPWDRKILHPMIEHFRKLKPTWLLFDADWMHTKQSKDYIKYCEMIVSVGRIKWIPDSKMTGKDNCAWYKFVDRETETRFIGR